MKCIKEIKTGKVTRVSDFDAQSKWKDRTHTYCPKNEFKAFVSSRSASIKSGKQGKK